MEHRVALTVIPEVAYILSRDLARAFHENAGPDKGFFNTLPKFPDGSVSIKGEDTIAEYFGIIGVGEKPRRPRNVELGLRLHASGVTQPGGFDYRSLAPFSPYLHSFSYTRFYQKKL